MGQKLCYAARPRILGSPRLLKPPAVGALCISSERAEDQGIFQQMRGTWKQNIGDSCSKLESILSKVLRTLFRSITAPI
uniref:Uncharacterized protein n=1 Tax=Ascaris lumbricoides TaxID=6252 RepID=A0A0M3I1W3_ASCLU